ncbi:RGS domain-containing protein [Lipomyces japonicus]|uniref:RGS domain-containing protein n=1 Tax=Lipomyces japonicus TaxID=56871 RepID=UPI0034CE9A6C
MPTVGRSFSSYFPYGPTSAPVELGTTQQQQQQQQHGRHDSSGGRGGLLQSGSTQNTGLPTLEEVLQGLSSSPYSLTDFMAYLAQNHCLENLEFTMDVTRYAEFYHSALAIRTQSLPVMDYDDDDDDDEEEEEEEEEQQQQQQQQQRRRRRLRRLRIGPHHESYDHLMLLWHRIMDSYVRSDSARQLNLPADVRDELVEVARVNLPASPDHLQRALEVAKDLMRESIFVRFLSDTRTPTDDGNVSLIERGESSALASSSRSTSPSHGSNSSGIWKFPSLNHHHHHHNHHHHHHKLIKPTKSSEHAQASSVVLADDQPAGSEQSGGASDGQSWPDEGAEPHHGHLNLSKQLQGLRRMGKKFRWRPHGGGHHGEGN